MDMKNQKAWYNRPLLSDKSLLDHLLSSIDNTKAKVSKDDVFIYERNLAKMRPLAEKIHLLDQEKFNNQEFILYARITSLLSQNLGDYADLLNSYESLRVAFFVKDNCKKFEESEFLYQSSKQKDFYKYVDELLSSYLDRQIDRETFNQSIDDKLSELLPQLKTSQGAKALSAYHQTLKDISIYDIGLELLANFKTGNMKDFVILKEIEGFINNSLKKDLTDINQFNYIVKMNYELLQKLGQVINIPEEKNIPTTYAQLLQYLALVSKHELSYLQFQTLTNCLTQWEKLFQENQSILAKYSPEDYHYPLEFTQPTPGLSLYEKYKSYI